MRKLTSDGYYDDDQRARANIRGEDFEVRDFDNIGHPPARSAPVHGTQDPNAGQPRRGFFNRDPQPQNPYPQQDPYYPQQPQSRRDALQRWNNNPVVQEMGVIAIEKTKMWLYFGIGIAIVLIALIGMLWFNGTFSKLADKDFSTSVNVDPPEVYNNYTHVINSNPSISNQHTIQNNITIEVPDSIIANAVEDGIEGAFDFDEMVDEITDNLVDELKPFIENTIKNATNST